MKIKLKILVILVAVGMFPSQSFASDLDPVDWYYSDRLPASYLALERLADRYNLDFGLSTAPVDYKVTSSQLNTASGSFEKQDESALALARCFLESEEGNTRHLHPTAWEGAAGRLQWWGGLRGIADQRSFSGVQEISDMDWLARAYLGARLQVGDFSADWNVVAERLNDEKTMALTDKTQPYPMDLARFPNYGKPWGSMAGDITSATLQYRKDWMHLWLGRRYMVWGQADYGRTLVSTAAGALDGLGADFTMGPGRLNWAMVILDPNLEKYASMHRLSARFWPELEVGIAESIIWAQRGIDFGYINPVIPYYVVQWNRSDVDNVQVSFDACWHPWQDLALYGELFIDDWQYDPVEGAPDKIASVAGLRWHDPLGLSAVRCNLEYSRVNRWTGTHKFYRNRYTHKDLPLGSPLGNDSDRWNLSLQHWLKLPGRAAGLAGLELSYTRRGDVDLITAWEKGEKGRGIPFPTPTVEHEMGLFTTGECYQVLDMLGGFARAGYRGYRNHARIAGETSGGLEATLGLNVGF